MRHDPEFRQFLSEIVDEKVTAVQPSKKKTGNSHQDVQIVALNSGNDTRVKNAPVLHKFKSPSDTTIYSPGLRKITPIKGKQGQCGSDESLIEKFLIL